MQSKLNGVRSLLLVGFTASLVVAPLHATSGAGALSSEELLTAYASTTAKPNSQRTVQVGPKDTLWSIARATRPDSSITIKQAMLAIRDANPIVFPSKNINDMELGERLIIPSAQTMKSRTAMEAEQEVRRQNQAWVASRSAAPATKPAPAANAKPEVKPVATSKPEAKPEATIQPAPRTSPPVAPKPAVKPLPLDLPDSKPLPRDLTLVAPKADEVQQQRIDKLKNDLASSEENLQTAEREKDELAERISDMQQQVSTLQKLIQLKDQQLTDMEQQLALEQAKQKPSVNPQPPVLAEPFIAPQPVTMAAEPTDLTSEIKHQSLLYGALAGLSVLLMGLFVALISARKKLKLANQPKKTATATTPEAVDAGSSDVDFTKSFASSKDFDIDLNANPLLDGLDNADGMDAFELEGSSDANLLAMNFDLDSLEDEFERLDDEGMDSSTETAASESPERDALQEAETFIAYGRLEQAAGFLQTALGNEPYREDLRLKLLEVLVELNDEETFRQQQRQLEQNLASSTALARAEELAGFFMEPAPELDAFSQPEAALIEEDLGSLAFDEQVQAFDNRDFDSRDFDGQDFDDQDFDDQEFDSRDFDDQALSSDNLETMDLDAMDLDAIFPSENESSDEQEAPDFSSPYQELPANLDDYNSKVDDSVDDLADIDTLDYNLNHSSNASAPLAFNSDRYSLEDEGLDKASLAGDDFAGSLIPDNLDTDNLDADRLLGTPNLDASIDDAFDLMPDEDFVDSDLEKPLDATELLDEGNAPADFEPVGYQSDADDFMQALDSLKLDTDTDDSFDNEPTETYQAPGVDEELTALHENLAELEAFSEDAPEILTDNDARHDTTAGEFNGESNEFGQLESGSLDSLQTMDDLADFESLDDLDDFEILDDLDDLDDFSKLDDLGNLGDLELNSFDGEMATQLDLATAYIEMGDKEGAREILEKVIKKGDVDFKATAKQMLEVLSN